MNWTAKNWFVQDFKKGMFMTQMSGVIMIGQCSFWAAWKGVQYVQDEDSLEQRMNIFHGQLYSLYSQGDR